jgi:hypothetical protein
VPVAAALALKSEIVSRLARFFPEATAVHLPVRISSEQAGEGSGTSHAWREETVVEFRTPSELLLAVRRPLQFGDTVLVESAEERLRAQASVVAAQYHVEQTVVAVRFLKPVPHWIVKL